MFYDKHIFICINQKADNLKCCAQGSAESMFAYLKETLATLGISGKGRIRVSKAGCLGRCKVGPSLVIYPEGIWYTYSSTKDIDDIIEQHCINGQIIKRLQLDAESLP